MLILRYWGRVSSLNPERLLYKTLIEDQKLIKMTTWHHKVSSLLSEYNLHSISLYLKYNKTSWDLKVKNNIQDHFQSKWEAKLKFSSKLSEYNTWVGCFGAKNYLNSTRLEHSDNLAKLRSGGCFLRIETGRHEALPREERLCPCCHKDVEHVLHFLLHCELYTSLRTKHFKLISNYININKDTMLKEVWNTNKMSILFGSSNNLQLNELVMAYAISCFRTRRNHLNLKKKNRFWTRHIT